MTTTPQYQPTDTTKFLHPSSLLEVKPTSSVKWQFFANSIIFEPQLRDLTGYRPGSCVLVRQSLRPHLLNYSTSQLLKVSFRVNGRLPLYLQYPKFQSRRNPAITDPYRLRQFSPVALRSTLFDPTYTQHFICHIQD